MIKTVIGAAMINLDDALDCTEDVLTFDEFDDEINDLIKEGWNLDKRYTIGKKSLYFVAELSREEIKPVLEEKWPEKCQGCFYRRALTDGKEHCTIQFPFDRPPIGCPREHEYW